MEAVAIQSTLLPRDKTTFNEANVCVSWWGSKNSVQEDVTSNKQTDLQVYDSADTAGGVASNPQQDDDREEKTNKNWWEYCCITRLVLRSDGKD
jgi:hypothetical protein